MHVRVHDEGTDSQPSTSHSHITRFVNRILHVSERAIQCIVRCSVGCVDACSRGILLLVKSLYASCICFLASLSNESGAVLHV